MESTIEQIIACQEKMYEAGGFKDNSNVQFFTAFYHHRKKRILKKKNKKLLKAFGNGYLNVLRFAKEEQC